MQLRRGEACKTAGKTSVWLVLAIGATLLAGVSALAQQSGGSTAAAGSGINPAKEATIRKLLELTGAKKNELAFGEQLTAYLKNMLEKNLPPTEHKDQISNSLITKVNARLTSDEFINRLIPVYDREFSQDDLKGIISFYESPAGHKFLESSGRVSNEANRISDEWIKTMIPEILDQLMEEFPELKQQTGAPAGAGGQMQMMH
jgi:uncharacterized protein